MVVRKAWMAMATLLAFAALPACATSNVGTTTTSSGTGSAAGGGDTGGGGGGVSMTTSSSSSGTGGKAPGCGDGIIATTESCDDGNTIEGDGCDAKCAFETPGWDCSGAPTVCVPKCGDGYVVGKEACDDGNSKKSDGCSDTCTVDNGWTCTGAPSQCATICGDGILAPGEECDDSNPLALDGCSDTCTVEKGWTCLGQPSQCKPLCGDGIVAVGKEDCDDKNVAPGDGCDSDCKTEPNYTCVNAPNQSSVCTTPCGDGIIAGNEVCDDHNTTNGDGCNDACKTEPGYTCVGMPSVCKSLCGDGIQIAPELCDDHNTANGDGCNALCKVEPGFNCLGTAPTVCTAICGDGEVVGSETCDVGPPVAGDGCDSNCKAEHGYVCNNSPSQCATVCGDGVIGGLEQCDSAGGPGCSAVCTIVPGYKCAGEPSLCVTSCGDGIQAGGEQCDDGNLVNGDCCSATCGAETGCEIEPNNLASMANDFKTLAVNNVVKGTIKPLADLDVYTVTVPAGQTGVITAVTLDGLTSACANNTEDSFITITDINGVSLVAADGGAPGKCAQAQATALPSGDYFIEVKSGSGTQFSYSLSIQVQFVVCGNGTKEPGEQCDDSNTVNGDGCSSACLIEVATEIEPNNTAAQALVNGVFPTNELWAGAISPVGDNDYYLLHLNAISDLRIETFDGLGVGSCVGIDTKIYLYATDGTTLLDSDDDSGINTCSLIDSTVAAHVGSRHLLPANYYLRVQRYLDSAVIAAYQVQVTFNAVCGNGIIESSEECDGAANCNASCQVIAVCGDGVIKAPETCDDGNLGGGDGCSATCGVELGYICSGTPSVCIGSESNCNDGIDNDGDGATDCADTECTAACAALTCAAGQSLYVFNATGLPLPIPDVATATSPLAVSVTGTVMKAAIKLSILHNWDSDVDIALRSPTVAPIDISSDNGGSSSNYTNTVFSDACATPITAGTAPFTGCFKPEAPLGAFTGQPANGTWTLTATDDAAGIAGTLSSWSLVLCVQ
jgi:cysteine-rich repeat protein